MGYLRLCDASGYVESIRIREKIYKIDSHTGAVDQREGGETKSCLPWTRCDGEDRQAAMTASYKKASAEV